MSANLNHNPELAKLLLIGIKVIVDDGLCVQKVFKQTRFPRSKKVRIRKKWKKNYDNYDVVEEHLSFTTQFGLFVSSKLFEQIKRKAKVV